MLKRFLYVAYIPPRVVRLEKLTWNHGCKIQMLTRDIDVGDKAMLLILSQKRKDNMHSPYKILLSKWLMRCKHGLTH